MQEYPDANHSGVRVRFAPSPTGPIHAGNIRTAIFNWLYARHAGGTLIVRMEDTDKERSRMEYADKAIETLEWLGIDWDEGPYYQSAHTALYEKILQQLVDQGKLYPCFCTEDELEKERKMAERKSKPPVYSGKCKNLSSEEREERSKEENFALRFAVEGGSMEYKDIIRGEIKVDLTLIGDFIARRSDGTVTYNFASAIDDSMMKISHVIRGEDHISNTPKQIMIMEALGYDKPLYAHLPLIFSMEGKKLSKRDSGTSVEDLRLAGYLPEAVFNYLALIGWSPEDKSENMTQAEMVKKFSLERVAVRGAKYDIGKLKWLNNLKVKNSSVEELIKSSKGFIKEWKKEFDILPQENQEFLITAVKENMETFSGVDDELAIFFKYELGSGVITNLLGLPVAEVLSSFVKHCDMDDFKEVCKIVSEEVKVKGKELFMPLRAGLSGRLHGPELKHIYSWLSPDERKKRLLELLEHYK